MEPTSFVVQVFVRMLSHGSLVHPDDIGLVGLEIDGLITHERLLYRLESDDEALLVLIDLAGLGELGRSAKGFLKLRLGEVDGQDDGVPLAGDERTLEVHRQIVLVSLLALVGDVYVLVEDDIVLAVLARHLRVGRAIAIRVVAQQDAID